METLAFLFGLAIATVGAVGLVAPVALVWLARHFLTSDAFYALAMVRIAFGVLLLVVAPGSRAPRALRVLGTVIVLLGVLTALTGLTAMDRARGAIEWWMQQGAGAGRLAAAAVLALGGFVAYACAPARRPVH